MDDNRIEIVASLDKPKSVSTIKNDLIDVSEQLDKQQALKIVCNIDLGKTAQRIQSQLSAISRNLSVSVPQIDIKTNTGQTGAATEILSKGFEQANVKAQTLKKTLTDLEEKYTKPLKPVIDTDGYINVERTLSKIQTRLSELGTVTTTARFSDIEGVQSLAGITAEIKAASGEVRTLNFEWSEFDKKFFATTGKFSDKGIVKVQQDVARLSKELANFESSHKAIESGLTEPLTQARNAIIDLQSGLGSVEAAERALDNLKTAASNIGANLKSSGSSFNIFDNATNKAENFDNIIKTLAIDINNLSPSGGKSELVSQLEAAIQKIEELRRIEGESGKGLKWSESYKEINTLLQTMTNNLKVVQKSDAAFNKEFAQAVKDEEKLIALKQQEAEIDKQRREQPQRDYWDGKFQQSIQEMTAENQVLKDMKKYYEDLNRATKETEKQQAQLFKDQNKAVSLSNRIKKLAADMDAYANANKRAVSSTKQMSDGMTFADKWATLTERMANSANMSADELRHLGQEFRIFGKEAESAGLKGESAFGKFLKSFKVMSSYITANMVFNLVKRQIRELVNEVTELDTAMVELRKVTVATDEDFRKFQESAAQSAKELGASITDIINATSTFARLGENLRDAEELGRVATLYKNVGDGIDINTASEDIVSTMKAFKIEAKDAITIIDKLNEVESCPFYILIERNRRHIFSNCWEILKSFSLFFNKRRKSEISKRIAYGEKKHIQSAKVVYVLSVV